MMTHACPERVGRTGTATGSATYTGVAFASSQALTPTHQVGYVNDGVYGNPSSWIGASPTAFVGIAFNGGLVTVNRVAWGRDNTGAFGDRWAGSYEVQLTTVESPSAATPDSAWTTVLVQAGEGALRHEYTLGQEYAATGLRIRCPGGVAIDELEVPPAAYDVARTATATQYPHGNILGVVTNVNNGIFGMQDSWAGHGGFWFAGLEHLQARTTYFVLTLAQPQYIASVAWSRDDTRQVGDRWDGQIVVQVTEVEGADSTTHDDHWTTILHQHGVSPARREFCTAIARATAVRFIVATNTGSADVVAFDEVSVFVAPDRDDDGVPDYDDVDPDGSMASSGSESGSTAGDADADEEDPIALFDECPENYVYDGEEGACVQMACADIIAAGFVNKESGVGARSLRSHASSQPEGHWPVEGAGPSDSEDNALVVQPNSRLPWSGHDGGAVESSLVTSAQNRQLGALVALQFLNVLLRIGALVWEIVRPSGSSLQVDESAWASAIPAHVQDSGRLIELMHGWKTESREFDFQLHDTPGFEDFALRYRVSFRHGGGVEVPCLEDQSAGGGTTQMTLGSYIHELRVSASRVSVPDGGDVSCNVQMADEPVNVGDAVNVVASLGFDVSCTVSAGFGDQQAQVSASHVASGDGTLSGGDEAGASSIAPDTSVLLAALVAGLAIMQTAVQQLH